ncbi:hypothetical protein Q5752_003440 [Cryptotrichosporon argae]
MSTAVSTQASLALTEDDKDHLASRLGTWAWMDNNHNEGKATLVSSLFGKQGNDLDSTVDMNGTLAAWLRSPAVLQRVKLPLRPNQELIESDPSLCKVITAVSTALEKMPSVTCPLLVRQLHVFFVQHAGDEEMGNELDPALGSPTSIAKSHLHDIVVAAIGRKPAELDKFCATFEVKNDYVTKGVTAALGEVFKKTMLSELHVKESEVVDAFTDLMQSRLSDDVVQRLLKNV